MSLQLCSRCEHHYFTPYEDGNASTREEIQAHPYPAQSRVTDTSICSSCGVDEAMRDHQRLAPIPPDEWPVGELDELAQNL